MSEFYEKYSKEFKKRLLQIEKYITENEILKKKIIDPKYDKMFSRFMDKYHKKISSIDDLTLSFIKHLAVNGYSTAQYILGYYYNLENDIEMAKYWYETAFANGFSFATIMLSDLHNDEENPVKGIYWALKNWFRDKKYINFLQNYKNNKNNRRQTIQINKLVEFENEIDDLKSESKCWKHKIWTRKCFEQLSDYIIPDLANIASTYL